MVLHTTSRKCYEWLIEQPNVKEESLTDWLLYYASKHINRIYYKAFTRNEEAYTGSNWEWWVLTDRNYGFNAYRFLVQAKKLKSNKDNYPLICYGNKNGLQIDLLIDSAKQRKAMPIYAYYSVEVPSIEQQLKNFNSDYLKQSIYWCENCKNGVYLSIANIVKNKIFDSPRRKINAIDLLNYSLKLSMFDLLFVKDESPDKIMDEINRFYIQDIMDGIVKMDNSIKYSENTIPNYLKAFIKNNNSIEEDGWYESEFSYYFNNISGIAVIDLRS